MIKTWFLEWMRARALRAAEREVAGFVDGLAAMEARELGALVAIATAVRVNMETYQVIPEGLFRDQAMPSVEAVGAYQMRINRVRRQFDRMRKPGDSAGALVWSYSLRCFNVPELRPLGLGMWAQLKRGFPYVADALKDGEAEKGEAFPERVWQEWDLVPVGLEPDPAAPLEHS